MESVFSETKRRSNNGLGKEITLCIKNKEVLTTTRKRPGRPRKLPGNPIAHATDVIYLSNPKSQGPPKYIPLRTRGGRGSRGGRVASTASLFKNNYIQTNRCVVYPPNSSTKTTGPYQYTSLITAVLPSTLTRYPKEVPKVRPKEVSIICHNS